MALQSSSESKAHKMGRKLASGVKALKRAEARLVNSTIWLGTPLRYRSLVLWVVKLLVVVTMAAFAAALAFGGFFILVIAAMPLDYREEEPTIDGVSHPRHQIRYPELYDDFGSLR